MLFKGMDIETEKWIISSIIEIIRNKIYLEYSEVDPESVGQFTGLTDKNGVKIFEGDICTHRFKRPWSTEMHKSEVVWNQAYCCYYLSDGISNHRMRDDIEYEVIGNIHANPELLK